MQLPCSLQHSCKKFIFKGDEPRILVSITYIKTASKYYKVRENSEYKTYFQLGFPGDSQGSISIYSEFCWLLKCRLLNMLTKRHFTYSDICHLIEAVKITYSIICSNVISRKGRWHKIKSRLLSNNSTRLRHLGNFPSQ